MNTLDIFISVFITFAVFGTAMAYYVAHKCKQCKDDYEPCSDYEEETK